MVMTLFCGRIQWKILRHGNFLDGVENVHVIRDDSISAWVNNSFALMHNQCTTAIEATISNKPVVTYIPFKTMYHDVSISNKLGYCVETFRRSFKNSK